jgi:hypothetical protein
LKIFENLNLKIEIYKIIVFPAVLYTYETWYLRLAEEHRLRALENRVQRRISGRKKEKVTGGCRKLHSGELHNVYASQNIIRMVKLRRMRWAEHVARLGEKRNPYRVLVGKRERK